MKLFVFTMLAVLNVCLLVAQGNVIFTSVSSDKNITQKTDGGESDLYFVVDGDESKGEVVLTFEMTAKPKEAYLIVNIPDKEWAESNDGFEVWYAGSMIGSFAKLMRNSWVEVKLDAAKLPSSGKFDITVKTTKGDGFYLCSKKSGRGAVLKIVF